MCLIIQLKEGIADSLENTEIFNTDQNLSSKSLNNIRQFPAKKRRLDSEHQDWGTTHTTPSIIDFIFLLFLTVLKALIVPFTAICFFL